MSETKVYTLYYKYKPGGFCTRLLAKMRAYLDKGWTVHYSALKPFPMEHPRLHFHQIPNWVGKDDTILFWLQFFLVTPWVVLFKGLRLHPDLISVFSPPYALICAPLKWVSGKPLVLFTRLAPGPSPADTLILFRKLGQLLDTLGLRVPDRIIANSKSSAELIRKQVSPSTTLDYLPNNLPELNSDPQKDRKVFETQLNIPPGAFIMCTSGRLLPRKNLGIILEALALLPHSPQVHFVFVGSGPMEEPLQSKAILLQLENQIHITGWMQNPHELVANSDLFVFPSLREGMSNSLLEALALGIPCLVSRIPENTDVLPTDVCHFPTDNPQALAQRMQRCIQEPEFLETLRKESSSAASHLDFNWGNRLVALVEPLLAAKTKI